MTEPIRKSKRVGTPPDGFNVTMETIIGRVEFGKEDGKSPETVAMECIGNYISHSPDAYDIGELTFRFQGPNENQMIKVEVTL